MQKLHFDLDQVERDIRALFERMPVTNKIDEIYKASVDAQVCMSRIALGSANDAIDTDTSLTAIEACFTSMIKNTLSSFLAEDEGSAPVAFQMLDAIRENLIAAYADKTEIIDRIAINSVQTGNA